MFVRQAAAIVVVATMFSSPPARATNEGSNALGVALASSALLGIACWTAEIMSKEDDREGQEVTKRQDFNRRGFYVAGGGVFGITTALASDERKSLKFVHAPSAASVSLETARPGVFGRAGYRCNPLFSIEGEAEWLSTFEGRVGAAGQGQISEVSVDSYALGSNILGHLPIGLLPIAERFPLLERFDPYLLFGTAVITIQTKNESIFQPADTANADHTTLALRFGGGLNYFLTRHIVLNAGTEYVVPVLGNTTFKYISLKAGLEYRF